MNESADKWVPRVMGVACPKCYRPIDLTHFESDCEQAPLDIPPAEIVRVLGWPGEFDVHNHLARAAQAVTVMIS